MTHWCWRFCQLIFKYFLTKSVDPRLIKFVEIGPVVLEKKTFKLGKCVLVILF